VPLTSSSDGEVTRRTQGLSRRAFLTSAAGVGAAAGAGALAGCSASAADEAEATSGSTVRRFVPFLGDHQAGITARPVPALSLMAAFTMVARDAAGLQTMFRDLSDEIGALMSGEPPKRRSAAYPPTDSGLLGDTPKADNLSIVVSVGASLFDERYGLSDLRPAELVTMPFLSNDRLDPARSHGDLLVTIEADHPDTVQFALRQLMRRVRGAMILAWTADGYSRGSTPADGSTGAPRNLMGFKDGTANLDTSDGELMRRHVWVADGDAEPAWAVGGSYQAVRLIRMFVEFWDRTPLAEQEAIMGRHKLSGAPLGRKAEHDEPSFAADPTDTGTPLDAHIRLANPRTSASAANLMLRRGFSYTRGFDGAGQLDQGLAFVSYQRSLEAGFRTVQSRLKGEPLEEYILPEGGGFFFALPGVVDESGYLGQGLFT